MLRVWLSLDSTDATHLNQVVVKKVGKLVNKLKNTHLPIHLAWKAYKYQLWPGARYGIPTLANRKDKVDSIMHKLEFEMLSFLGVNHHIKSEWRHLDREFGGIGLFNLTVEQFIGWIEIMLQHSHTRSTLSGKITASVKALQLENGCRGNPLNEDHGEQGLLATDCWVKAVWECMYFYNFCICLNYTTQHFPWEGDQELVAIFLANNIQVKELISLNQCQIAHKAMYLSCIAMVDGIHLDRAFLLPPMDMECQSIWKFSHETPTAQEWKLWEAFWQQYCTLH